MTTYSYPSLRYAASTLLALGLVAAASAENLPEHADISGEWAFATGSYHGGLCSMNGHMTISTPDKTGQQSCVFTTYERCGEDYAAEIQQACVLSRTGKQVSITSTITNIVHMTPVPYQYAPDHWQLTIRSEQEMYGKLISAHGSTALFTRDHLPLS